VSTIVEEYGLRTVTPFSPAGFKTVEVKSFVNSTELIGIEVEVENARNVTQGLNKVWQVVADGSLRNNGLEFITRPIPASAAPVCLEYLLNQYLAKDCCFGPRTSIHIHLNMQDMTRSQVVDFVLLYSIYEKLFYKFTGRGRQKNIYCVPLSDCDLLPYLVEYGETRDGSWSKYTGLNTLPIREHGTVEFRHMHGTTDVAKLSTWINLICKLKEHIRRTTSKQVRTMISEMNDGFDFGGLLQEIFGDYAGAFRYEGPEELNYLQAKQALSSRNNVRTFQNGLSSSSAFHTFKG
jgi:hypothetical protein